MQGYGSRARLVVIGLALVAASTVTSCSLLDDDAEPGRIAIPGTDPVSTESAASSLSATSASRGPDSTRTSAEWSYERIIKAAPRVSNADYHEGATSESGERSDASGFHFSTEDRSIRCSTGNSGAEALACVGAAVNARKRTDDGDSKCDWQRDYAVLDANGAKAGACANRYPVLYRSRIVPSGEAVVVDRFACLADNSDLYCIETSSGKGFAVTRDGYREIKAGDRAPRSLLGLSDQSTSSDVYDSSPSDDSSPSSVAPTS
ncbi:hypothetical protein [Gordonia shandongensis]|uniref:hypothetical protein n=1 Tax=Gordonia shandongensis TaxID=376351 RepID=UPI00041B5D48|nr:hypothetical protein [Gordonia shandongensis]